MVAASPAPLCTATVKPSWISLTTTSGTVATRFSPAAVSAGTPIIRGMKVSGSSRESGTGAACGGVTTIDAGGNARRRAVPRDRPPSRLHAGERQAVCVITASLVMLTAISASRLPPQATRLERRLPACQSKNQRPASGELATLEAQIFLDARLEARDLPTQPALGPFDPCQGLAGLP